MHLPRLIALSALVLSASVVPQRASAQKVGSASFAPTRVPAREVPGPSTRQRVGNWMMVGGGALLLAGWGTNALGGLGAGVDCTFGFGFGGRLGGGGSGCNHDAAWEDFRTLSLVPVVGPYAQLALLPDGARDGGWPGWLVASAIVQTTGLALLIAGLVTRLRGAGPPEPRPGPTLSVLPTITPDGAGLSVSSSF